jgi:PAS domain S-box-containing protein
MQEKILNFLYGGYRFNEDEDGLKYKYLFLNNIIIVTIAIAVVMGIKRYINNNIILGLSDSLFAIFLLFMLFYIKTNKKKFELISHIILFISFLFINIVLIFDSKDDMSIIVYFPFLASVIFLKGRFIGLIYLILATIYLAIFKYFELSIHYPNVNLLLTLVYIVMFYLIIGLYESIRHSHSSALKAISQNRSIQNKKLRHIMKSFNKYVIFSKTDLNGKIIYVNEAFCNISGYTQKELIGKPHNMVRHDDMTKQTFEKLWQDLRENKYWHGEIKNKSKDGGFYWVDSIIEAEYDLQDNHIGYHSVRQNITDKKEIEILKENLENTNIDLEDQVHKKVLEVMHLNNEIRDSQKEIIFTIGIIGESRSKETANHVKRVAEYSKLLAKYSGLDDYRAELLKLASPMHDIGKVGISDAILNKPGRLTQQEMKIMMTHTELGYAMLKHSDKELLKLSASIAYEHHEKYDGSGYPRGLKGEEICIEGRITAVADVFDALGSNRVYKKSWRDEDIFSMFIKEKGKHFDPKIIDIFLEHKQDFIDIRNKFLD